MFTTNSLCLIICPIHEWRLFLKLFKKIFLLSPFEKLLLFYSICPFYFLIFSSTMFQMHLLPFNHFLPKVHVCDPQRKTLQIKYSNIFIQQNATLYILFISGNRPTCFGWYHHPSPGAHTTVSTASIICHTFTATCGYRGRVRTGLSVLWVAYATHSTLKPVPTLSR
jgi:hypothetical protein